MSLNDRQSVRLLEYLDAQFDAFTNDLVTSLSPLSSRLPLLSALHTLILNPRLSPTLLFPFLLRLSSAFHDLLTSYDLPSEFHDPSTRAQVLDALRRLDQAWVDVLRERRDVSGSGSMTVPVTGTDRVRLRCVLRELRDALRSAVGRESKRVKVDVRTGEITQDDEGATGGLGTLKEEEGMQVDEERRDEEGEPVERDEQRMDDDNDDDDDDDDDAEFEEVDVLSPGGDDQELFSIHFKAPPAVPMPAPTPEPIPPKREPDEEEFGLESGRAGEKGRLGVDLDEMEEEEEEEEEEEGDGEELDLEEEIEKVFRRSLGILEEGEGRAE